MVAHHNINGYILAGGKSSRMGADKGLMQFNGQPIVKIVAGQLQQVAEKVAIVSNNRKYEQFGFEVITDQVKGIGPAGGIYSALNHSEKELNFIVSCDMPFVTAAAVDFLLKKAHKAEITLPVKQGMLEPLFGVYMKSCADKWLELIQKKFTKLSDFAEQFNTQYVEVEGSELFGNGFFTNINTKSDFEKALNLQVNEG